MHVKFCGTWELESHGQKYGNSEPRINCSCIYDLVPPDLLLHTFAQAVKLIKIVMTVTSSQACCDNK
jgi:hypothetical protein